MDGAPLEVAGLGVETGPERGLTTHDNRRRAGPPARGESRERLVHSWRPLRCGRFGWESRTDTPPRSQSKQGGRLLANAPRRGSALPRRRL